MDKIIISAEYTQKGQTIIPYKYKFSKDVILAVFACHPKSLKFLNQPRYNMEHTRVDNK